MDISPKALREVEFREKLRGYHPEDVDEFLEQVAAGVEALQERLRQATERAVHAEHLAEESGTNDESIRRTLVLAQRTADMAIEEAREQAKAIVAEAEERARHIVSVALAEAEELARRAQDDLRSDLDRLTTSRESLRTEVDALEQWVGEHRSALSTSLVEALRRLEEGLVTGSAPEPAELDIPEPPPPARAELAEPGEGEPEAPGTDGDGTASPEDAVAGTHDSDSDDDSDSDAAASSDDVGENTGEIAAVPAADMASGEHDDRSDGDLDAHDDDPFMAELRRAVTDDEPLGPRDEGEPMPVPTGHDREFEEGPADRRFGNRRRWRK